MHWATDNRNGRIRRRAAAMLLAVCFLLFAGAEAAAQSVQSEERTQAAQTVQNEEKTQAAQSVQNEEKTQTAQSSVPEIDDFSGFDGKTIGMLTGAPFEEMIRSRAPGVKEILYFSSMPDMITALKAGKVDGFLNNNAVAQLMINQDRALALFPESLGDTWFGFAFQKGSAERQKWQDAFDQIPDEDIERAWQKWTGADEKAKILPEQDWPGNGGTVHVAACDTLPPMSYRSDDEKVAGFDIEIILRMAQILDVHVVFDGMEFASVMPAVESGKALLGTGSIITTQERMEVVDFVNYHPAAFVLIVRSVDGGQSDAGFWSRLKGSFYRTFVKGGRYKMVLSGLGVTVLISLLSGLAGLFLAFVIVFVRHRDNPFANRVISVYSGLIAGIPAVVILMVLYYIVFGRTAVSAVVVAIVGFSLIFAARAFGVIWNEVGAVDPGQREAALALGYSEERAFREIILPQAERSFRPLLVAQFTSLVKETSVAGYITVVELTRVGDLIRSRTMEAFFPLIAIALLYLALTWILKKAADLYERYLAAKREERKIKGVDA